MSGHGVVGHASRCIRIAQYGTHAAMHSARLSVLQCCPDFFACVTAATWLACLHLHMTPTLECVKLSAMD